MEFSIPENKNDIQLAYTDNFKAPMECLNPSKNVELRLCLRVVEYM